jgi:hypothetical protein
MATEVQLTLDAYLAEAVRLAAKELAPTPGRCQLCDAPTDAGDALCEECVSDDELQERWRAQSDRRHTRESIAGYYEACRRAIALARTYRAEPQSSGRRERECVETIARYRGEIRKLRLEMRGVPRVGPGLSSARRARQAEELGAVIEEIGDDVRLRRARSMFGATTWEASAPMAMDRRYRAHGATPAEALVALRDAIREDARDEDEARAATR